MIDSNFQAELDSLPPSTLEHRVKLDYMVLQEFAWRYGLSYNELCTMVRRAIITEK